MKRLKNGKQAARLRLLSVLCAALSLGACSLDYGSGFAEELAEEMPDTVVYEYERVVVQSGKPRFRLKAEKAMIFENAGKVRIEKVSFQEYALDGSGLVGEGTADSGVFYTKTESAELNGNVRFASLRDKISVSSGFLSWDGEARTLASRLDSVTTVTIRGSSLSGAGFRGEAKTRSFSFAERVEGYYADDKQDGR